MKQVTRFIVSEEGTIWLDLDLLEKKEATWSEEDR
jgi:hypothetical protein